MKAYTDALKKPLDKHEVAAVVRLMIAANRPSTSFVTRRFGMGFGKAFAIIMLLDDAGVISPMMRGKRTIILKDVDTAINAALRQLKRGKQ